MTTLSTIVDAAEVKTCWQSFLNRFGTVVQARRVRMWNDWNFDYVVCCHPALGIRNCHVADWRS